MRDGNLAGCCSVFLRSWRALLRSSPGPCCSRRLRAEEGRRQGLGRGLRQLSRPHHAGRAGPQHARRHLGLGNGDDASLAAPSRTAVWPPDAGVRWLADRRRDPRDGRLHPRDRRQGEDRRGQLRGARGQRHRSEREARLQARDRRRGRDRAVGRGLPARRPHAHHGEGRRAAHRRREGRVCARARHGRARGVVEGPGRAARRGRASRLREERLDLPLLQRSRRERLGDDGGRPRQAEGQRAGRAYSRCSRRRLPPIAPATCTSASRFVFDGKGHVFFSIGERGQQPTRRT